VCLVKIWIDETGATKSDIMMENLKELNEKGMKESLETQGEKYECPKCGDVIAVHDGKCYTCGYKKGEVKPYGE
jgi:rubrerythrin